MLQNVLQTQQQNFACVQVVKANLDKSCHKQITKVTITAQFLGRKKIKGRYIYCN